MADASAQTKQFKRMTTTPVSRLIPVLAVPTVLSMLVTAIYNMADTYFVSQLGTEASAAVGVCFAIMALIQAVGFLFAMGTGTLLSQRLGQRLYDVCEQLASLGLYAGLFFGLSISVLSTIFLDPLLQLLGANDAILPFARAYAGYIVWGAPLMCGSFILNLILRSQGLTFYAMIGLMTGGIINIILDPILIFVLDLQTAGAAIATIISQGISFTLLYVMIRRKSLIQLKIRVFQNSRKLLTEIFIIGMPSLFRQGLASISIILLNNAAVQFGTASVAAMSIVSRLAMFIISVMLGVGQAFQPVAGYNYGAKLYGRVREAYRFTLTAGFLLMLFFSLVGLIFAPQIIMAFRADDPEVIAIGTFALRAQCLTAPLLSLLITTNMLVQSVGLAKEATALAMTRQGLLLIPLLLALPPIIGLRGVQIAQPIADLLSVIVALWIILRFMRQIRVLEMIETGKENSP